MGQLFLHSFSVTVIPHSPIKWIDCDFGVLRIIHQTNHDENSSISRSGLLICSLDSVAMFIQSVNSYTPNLMRHPEDSRMVTQPQ